MTRIPVNSELRTWARAYVTLDRLAPPSLPQLETALR